MVGGRVPAHQGLPDPGGWKPSPIPALPSCRGQRWTWAVHTGSWKHLSQVHASHTTPNLQTWGSVWRGGDPCWHPALNPPTWPTLSTPPFWAGGSSASLTLVPPMGLVKILGSREGFLANDPSPQAMTRYPIRGLRPHARSAPQGMCGKPLGSWLSLALPHLPGLCWSGEGGVCAAGKPTVTSCLQKGKGKNGN